MKHRLLPTKCELYHGKENTRPYFEGWYFKNVSKNGDFMMSVICGVSRSKDARDDHSFIQIITGPTHESRYIRFAYNAFKYDEDTFKVSIGNNTFSMDKIYLAIDRKDININANLRYSKHIYLQKSTLSPSIMGPFSYIPNMECNHGVLSLKNNVLGSVVLDGRVYDMNEAIGYIEKDWGEAFPNAWIWLQGNELLYNNDVAFMCSIASIPFGALKFTGLICVLSIGDRQYRFATYNGTKIKNVASTKNGVDIVLKKGRYSLVIGATTGGFEKLIAPSRNGMDRELYESISADIDINLFEKGKLIFKVNLANCGMEISEIGELVK